MTEQDNDKMPFTTHLEDLKKIIVRSLIAIGIGFVICYIVKERLFTILAAPLSQVMPEGSTMVYTGLPEAFFTYLKISLFASIFLTAPYWLYQVWSFVSPGLYDNEKKYVFPFVIVSTLFFIGGALFAYYIVFPFGFKFFVAFTTEFIKPMISVKEFLSFSMKLLLAFGVIFELPIFMYFLAKVGLVTSRTLSVKRKYAYLLVFVVAAFFTPPDVVTQVLMAFPLMVLYEISIWVVKFAEKKKKESNDDKESDVTDEEDAS